MARERNPSLTHSVDAFIQSAMRSPLLSRESEQALARRWVKERDPEALDRLVRSYSRLVVKLAAKFRAYGLAKDDLVQQGHVGLLEALMRFEPERGLRLSTYASWWIRASIQDFVLRNWSIVRIGSTTRQKALFFNLRRLRAQIAAAGLGLIGSEERALIAEELRVAPSEVEAMEQQLAGGDQSLNAPIGRDMDDELQDLLEDSEPSPEHRAIQQIDGERRHVWLTEALNRLPERERIIIRERHLSEDPPTLQQMGDRFGVSKERARQLEKRAMELVRADLRRKAAM